MTWCIVKHRDNFTFADIFFSINTTDEGLEVNRTYQLLAYTYGAKTQTP